MHRNVKVADLRVFSLLAGPTGLVSITFNLAFPTGIARMSLSLPALQSENPVCLVAPNAHLAEASEGGSRDLTIFANTSGAILIKLE